jgi:hypothetical protein
VSLDAVLASLALASLALEARLLFDGALGSGNRFQSLIGKRLSALYGEATCASGKPLLGVLDRGQLGPQIIGLPLVEFLLVETRCGVRHPVPSELIRARDPKLGERLFHAVAFAAKKLPCSFGIHLLSAVSHGGSSFGGDLKTAKTATSEGTRSLLFGSRCRS